VDGRAAPDKFAFQQSRQGGGCRDLRADGLCPFFGVGEHNSNSHEEDDDLGPTRLFVGLPIDPVTNDVVVNGTAAIVVGICAVQLSSPCALLPGYVMLAYVSLRAVLAQGGSGMGGTEVGRSEEEEGGRLKTIVTCGP
jgi:hypothetical protein